jgi:hypothetical protein
MLKSTHDKINDLMNTDNLLSGGRALHLRNRINAELNANSDLRDLYGRDITPYDVEINARADVVIVKYYQSDSVTYFLHLRESFSFRQLTDDEIVSTIVDLITRADTLDLGRVDYENVAEITMNMHTGRRFMTTAQGFNIYID